MAVALGTNSGFVTVAPTADPAGSNFSADNRSFVTKDTSPATAGKITEIGWWCDAATEASNFEVGLYAADGATVPGEAGTRLFVAATNAKGTTSGWKTVTVDWTIAGNTAYWIGFQLDDTVTSTPTNYETTGGSGMDPITPGTSLNNPNGGGAISYGTGLLTVYAVWEAAAAAGPANLKSYNTNLKANIKSINTNLIANVKSLNTNV